MKRKLICILLALCLLCSGCTVQELAGKAQSLLSNLLPEPQAVPSYTLDDLPEFDGETPYVVLTENAPGFTSKDLTASSYETYGEPDALGRCTVCMACIGPDLMPTEDREPISDIHPTGWRQARYDIVEGESLYNRCHLIGFQLTGEDANRRNLITGTRFLNVSGMLPFENRVARYIRATGNHVLYRVTPIFRDQELVARGVELEARSVEDGDLSFHVYCYNVQPGIYINYETGESALADDLVVQDYVLNTHTGKFHLPDCPGALSMAEQNRQAYSGTRLSLIQQGWSPCGSCKP